MLDIRNVYKMLIDAPNEDVSRNVSSGSHQGSNMMDEMEVIVYHKRTTLRKQMK